jgi:transcriptional repressor NrdR
MVCPSCRSENLRVLEKRDIEGEPSIRRRRECADCGFRFTTYERLETPTLAVVKKDGRKEVYIREKLSDGIYRAFEKRPTTAPEIEDLVTKIEKEIKTRGENEIKSSEIGNLVMGKLLEIDEVAYLRFASVYKSFKNLTSFVKEVESLNSLNKTKEEE